MPDSGQNRGVEFPIKLEPIKPRADDLIKFTFREGLTAAMLPRVIFVLGIIILFKVASHDLWFDPIGFLIIIPLGVFMRWFLIYRLVNSPLNRYAWLDRHVEFDTVEIRTKNEIGLQHIVPWNGVAKVKLTQNRYILWMSASMAFIIPQSSFKVPADEVAFREILARHRLI